MSTQSDLQLIQYVMDGLNRNPVERFSYTPDAFDNDMVDGVDVFDRNAEQNIPKAGGTDYNPTVISKGVRTQGASIPRAGWNHYIGRISYNLNKIIQKALAFTSLYRSAMAHNANEYDQSALYRTGDVCYTVETVDNVKVYTWHQRVSLSPETIRNIPPDVTLHWIEVQNKSALSSTLPFSAPCYRHKFTIADLTGSQYRANRWYPVTTDAGDFKLQVEKAGNLQILFEVFCRGSVAGINSLAELTVLSKFTGCEDSSTDVLLNDLFIDTDTGAARNLTLSPVGFSKLVKGYQAVIWLRGGGKYALWNSCGSNFTLHASQYYNGVDPSVTFNNGARVLELSFASIKARVKTTDAVEPDDAVAKSQIDGAIPLPKTLGQMANLRSVRTPGVYIITQSNIADSILDGPVQNPGPFELTVTGDRAGLSVTVQRMIIRACGDEYTRVLAGQVITVDWYLSSSPHSTGFKPLRDPTPLIIEGGYYFVTENCGYLVA
jgi:hypothetical protein